MKKILLILLFFSISLLGQETLDIGNIVDTDLAATSANYSYLSLSNAANGDGYVDSITVMLGAAATADTLFIGSLYLSSGTTYTLRDSSYIIITGDDNGTYGFSAPSDFDKIQVNSGDLIAVFGPTTNGAIIRRDTDASTNLRYVSAAGTKFYEQESTNFNGLSENHNLQIEFIGALGLGFYVDADKGSNTNSGVWFDEAWQTIAKVNAETFNPNDFVYLRTNDKWAETVIVPSSGVSGNQITISKYDSTGENGNNPIVTQINVNDKDYITVSNCITATNGVINTGTGYVLDVSECPLEARFKRYKGFPKWRGW